ncbi:LexA repressor [compost metagenome]
MDFFTTTEPTPGEQRVLQALREAFRQDEGLCFLRYPFFETRGRYRHEPDILILHRELGLLIIEVKDLEARHVLGLDGHTWQMVDWYKEHEEPYAQAEAQMWTALRHFNREPALRDRLRQHALVALPNVTHSEWAAKGFTFLPCNPAILHQDDLGSATLRRRLTEIASSPSKVPLTDAEWQKAKAVLGCGSLIERVQGRGAFDDALASIAASEQRLVELDHEQLRIGLEIPPGPQRIRGIAGSGKTLLLAMKAVRMHLAHPDWDIAFTFNTKSLYQAIRGYLTELCQHFGDTEPNWNKLHVLHGWGGKTTGDGLYYVQAKASGHTPRTPDWIKRQFGYKPIAESLAVICRELLDSHQVPQRFDAILIDEGQDFLPEFYQLAYHSLKEPKRLIWAYDEAQSLDHLSIPTSENLFGRDEAGKLLVDVAGQYPGGIYKSRIMRRCYRMPRQILLAAHAVGMGLLRSEGPLQSITTKPGWQAIGYTVETGAFDHPGAEVVLVRTPESCGHPLDASTISGQALLRFHGFMDREAELDACARHIARQIKGGIQPEQIMIVHLERRMPARDLEIGRLAQKLETLGYRAHLADKFPSDFRMPGAVTVTGVHRAKGNEAPFVHVLGLDYVDGIESDVTARNHLFVALTRSRGQCIVSGIQLKAQRLFAEFEDLRQMGDRIVFRAPDPKKLKRRMDDEGASDTERSATVAKAPAKETPSMLPAPPMLSEARNERFKTHLPLYDLRAAAGLWGGARIAEDGPAGWIDASSIGKLSEDMFALRVAGKSMEPQIPDGAIAAFRRIDGTLPEGKIVLAQQLQDDGESISLVVKRLTRTSNGYRLDSLNPLYPALPFAPFSHDGVRILGVYLGLLDGATCV